MNSSWAPITDAAIVFLSHITFYANVRNNFWPLCTISVFVVQHVDCWVHANFCYEHVLIIVIGFRIASNKNRYYSHILGAFAKL